MNGEINSVPIISLAGIASLSDLLPEMPLPSPVSSTLSSRSVLFHPRVTEEAQRLLSTRDESLAAQLQHAISYTSSQHIQLKDGRPEVTELPHLGSQQPELLAAILHRNPYVFRQQQQQQLNQQQQHWNAHQQPGYNVHKQQPVGYTSPAAHVGAYTPVQGYATQPSPAPALPAQAAINAAAYGQQGSPYSTQTKYTPTPNNSYPTPTQGYNSPGWGGTQSYEMGGSTTTCVTDNSHPQQQQQQQQQLQQQLNTVIQKEATNDIGSKNQNNETKFPPYSAPAEPPVQFDQTWSGKTESTVVKEEPVAEPPVPVKKAEAEIKPKTRISKSSTVVNSNKRSSGRPSYKEESSSGSEYEEGEEEENSSSSSSEEEFKQKKPLKTRSREATPRKRKAADEPAFSIPDASQGGASSAKKKLKRIERKITVSGGEKVNIEELMESNTYQRFSRLVESIFDATDDVDLHASTSLDEDAEVPPEAIISKQHLHDLCAEAAKLKSMGAMSAVPPERLVRLLNLLEKNIRDGAKISLLGDPDEDEEESKLWTELASERVVRAVEATLAALHILTAAGMPKRVYLEDVIERIITFARFQLLRSIYPAYDPVYRTDAKDKEALGGGSLKRKRAHVREVRDRTVLLVYHKLVLVVGLLAELLNLQTLTDTAVLHLSSMGVAPFFVENVSELQLSALRLVTAIFSRYEKHRRLLLDDILASIARLPSSKRSLRTFRLSADQHIQMLTALVLQLVQCVPCLPEKLGAPPGNDPAENAINHGDPEVVITTRYDMAKRTSMNFLSVFLGKCSSKNSDEVDYRPLFENFVQDLMSTVNKPEWPAAELLLSLLGKLLVQNFSNKSVEMSLRVASLEYLGVIAARLRRDAVTSQLQTDTIEQLLKQVRKEQEDDGGGDGDDGGGGGGDSSGDEQSDKKRKKKKRDSVDKKPIKEEAVEDRNEQLYSLLLDYLAVNSQADAALLHARHFYLAQWYTEAAAEIRQEIGAPAKAGSIDGSPKKRNKHAKSKKRRRRNRISDDESDESSDSSSQSEEEEPTVETNRITQLVDKRKKFLLKKVPAFPEAPAGARTQVLTTPLDGESSELIARFLAAKRPFSQSFDGYLKYIINVLTEPAVAVRTKAMKCLTQIVESDPSVLGRSDMQMGVNHSFLDQSTSVREAAVDLVGKFVLSRPELIDKYYDMLSARILDTGVSVRKRVIKIMKDICIDCPSFPKIPEICVKMIRRVNDEESGIKKLVMEVFQTMWFSPIKEKPSLDFQALLRKVMNITDVVAACKDTGLDWLEQLLTSLFRPKEDKDDSTKVNTEPPPQLVTACRQIVDCLVENVMRLERASLGRSTEHSTTTNCSDPGDSKGSSQRLVACLTTLYLFAKIRPQLLVQHAMTLQPYLSLRCQTQGDFQIISAVARTLELVVPLVEHPSETFLAQLEEDSVKLILQHDKTVVMACLSCLGSVVNEVTHNYKLICDCFRRYFDHLKECKARHEVNPNDPKLVKTKPLFRRALFTVGLLIRHFDFTRKEVRCDLPETIKQDVMDILLYFVKQECTDTQYFTLQAIGSVCIRHYDFMLGEDLKRVYLRILQDPDVLVRLKAQVLSNIETYLQEEEIRMIREDQQWSKLSKKENLKEMGDVTSGMASTVIQLYLKPILDCFIHPIFTVRQAAFRVTQLILQQGLVHPVQIVPYLICMSTDPEQRVSHSADKQLQEIEKKYPGFIHMKSLQGIRLSFQLQSLLCKSEENRTNQQQQQQQQQPQSAKKMPKNYIDDRGIVRGFRLKEGEPPQALNGFLYSILRTTKQQRRAVVLSMLKQFDELSKTPLAQLLYFADNLATFPYQVIDEPLFLMHHIDIMVSVTGSNLLQAFQESLIPVEKQSHPHEEDDDEDVASLLQRLPDDTRPFEEYMTAAQGCSLLLMIKQHLKDCYGLTDAKISQYSPSEAAKVYEKNASRKSLAAFVPRPTILALREGSRILDEAGRRALIERYLEFKQMMLRIDPAEEDEEERLASAMRTYQVNVPSSPMNHGNSTTAGSDAQTPSSVPTPATPVPATPLPVPTGPGTPLLGIPGIPILARNSEPPITLRISTKALNRTPKMTSRSPRVEKTTPKKKHRKRKRRALSDESSEDDEDCDPDFRV